MEQYDSKFKQFAIVILLLSGHLVTLEWNLWMRCYYTDINLLVYIVIMLENAFICKKKKKCTLSYWGG